MADDEFVLTGYRWPWQLRQPGELRGRVLRYLLTALLAEAGAPITIQQLIARCEREGVVFDGRASKIVSDALRWEINGGRVMRVRRGVYRSARMPRSTRHWRTKRVRDIRAYLARIRGTISLRRPDLHPGALGPRWPTPATGFIT